MKIVYPLTTTPIDVISSEHATNTFTSPVALSAKLLPRRRGMPRGTPIDPTAAKTVAMENATDDIPMTSVVDILDNTIQSKKADSNLIIVSA